MHVSILKPLGTSEPTCTGTAEAAFRIPRRTRHSTDKANADDNGHTPIRTSDRRNKRIVGVWLVHKTAACAGTAHQSSSRSTTPLRDLGREDQPLAVPGGFTWCLLSGWFHSAAVSTATIRLLCSVSRSVALSSLAKRAIPLFGAFALDRLLSQKCTRGPQRRASGRAMTPNAEQDRMTVAISSDCNPAEIHLRQTEG